MPAGKFAGVFLFNVSTDDVECTAEELLADTDDEAIHVGDFFDKADREFLRRREMRLDIFTNSLLPSIIVQEDQNLNSGSVSFNNNRVVIDEQADFEAGITASSTPVRHCHLYTSPSPRDS